MSDVMTAERVSMQRAVIFYLLTGALVVSVVLTRGERDPIRLLPWFVTVALGTANLFTVGLMRSPRLKALVNDESTRRHRALALSGGFWAALVVGLFVAAIAPVSSITPILAARSIVTATLVVALLTFATLELRASR